MKSQNIRKMALAALAIAPAIVGSKAFAALPDSTAANLSSTTASWGSATPVGSVLTVNLTNSRTILQWGAFSVASGDTVTYVMPASGAVLNKITGAGASVINGSITAATGSVYFINPNCITIAPTLASDKIVITSGDFAVSTIQEPDASFTNTGKLNFIGPTQAGGTITVSPNAADGTVAVIDVGATGNIYLAGTNIDASGKYAGNLWVKGAGGTTVKVSGTGIGSLDISAQDASYTTVQLGAAAAGLTISGDLTVATAGNVDLAKTAGTSVITGNVSVKSTAGAISSTNAVLANGATKTVTLEAAGDVTFGGNATTLTVTKGADVTISDADGIKLGSTVATGNVHVTATSIDMATASDKFTLADTKTLTYSSAGSVTLAIAAASSGKPTVAGTLASTSVTLTADGDLDLGAINTATTLSVKSSGNVTGSGVVKATTATFEVGKNLDLSTQNNQLAKVILKGGAGNGDTATVNGISILNSGNITIENGTAVTGATTIKTAGNGNVLLGDTDTDVLTFAKPLTLDINGTGVVTTTAKSVTLDNLVLKGGGGDLTIGVSTPANNQLTVKNVSASGTSNVLLYTNSAIEFGSVDIAGKNLTVFANTGSITQTDVIKAANVQVEAIAGSVTLTKANVITGPIDLVGGANHGVQSDFTLTNTKDTVVSNAKIGGIASFNVGKNALSVSGAFAQAKFTASSDAGSNKNISITSSTALTLLGSTYAGTLDAADDGAITISSTGDLTIGNDTSFFSAEKTTFTSTGKITQAGGKLWLYGDVKFAAADTISVADASNNFGGIEATTSGASKDITIKEASGVLRVVSVDTGLGNVTLTNSNGDVSIGYTGKNGSIGATLVPTNITLNSDAGSVIANLGTTTGFNIVAAGSLSGTAKNDFLVATTNGGAVDFNLGNITTTTGKFAVSGVAPIKQATGTHLSIAGNASFTSTKNDLLVENSGNSFGTLSVVAGATASIKQSGNVVLAKATVNDLTVTSESGSITDDTAGNSGADKIVSAGTMTLKASSVTIDDGDGTYNKVALIVSGDASFASTDVANDLILVGGGGATGTTVGGKLTVTSAKGISEVNGISVGGQASFKAASTISLLGSNTFGTLVLRANGAVSVTENDGMNLVAGTNTTGSTTLTSAGDIVASGSSYFNGPLTLNASGAITLSDIIIGGQLSTKSLGATNLGSLSKALNLSGLTPINNGASSYTGPKD